MTIASDAAFPVQTDPNIDRAGPGLTKREYFAALAMQAIVSANCHEAYFAHAWTAKNALDAADALIAGLNGEIRDTHSAGV